MKRVLLLLTALCLLLSGCGVLPAMTEATTVPVITVAPSPSPTPDPWPDQAAEALAGVIPRGMSLVQVAEGDGLARRLVPEAGEGALLLPTISRDAPGETLTPVALADAAFMEDAALLARAGLTLDLTRYDADATRGEVYGLLVGAVKALGYPVEASSIDAAFTVPLLREAMALELEPYCPDATSSAGELYLADALSLYQFQQYATRLVTFLETRAYLRAGRQATLQDAARLWPLVTGQERVPFSGSNAAMTRMDLGLALLEAYRTRYATEPATPEETEWAYLLTDQHVEETALLRRYALMDCYPHSDDFSADLGVWMDKLPEILNTFFLAYCDGPAAREEEYTLEGDPAPARTPSVYQDMMTYAEAVHRTAMILAAYRGEALPVAPAVEVVNLPENSIYMSQMDGSEYAAVNCMPTMLCMALRWYDPRQTVTPSQLRAKYPDVTGGWYLYMVQEQLAEYGVPYISATADRRTLTDALDAGNVILAQFSTWDISVSGHCYMIVGYRRQGGALWFCVEDPGECGLGVYGRPENDRRWLEAEQALWTINRFVPEVTVVSRTPFREESVD